MMQPSPDAPGGPVALTIAPDRRALVPGAASGFGLGVVDRLLEAGARVAMADFSEALLRDEAGRRADGGLPVGMGVRGRGSVQAGVAAAVDWLGGLDPLVQCAGVFDYGSLEETTEESWDRQLDTNLKGTFLVAQAAIRHLVGSGRGRM